MFLKCFQNYSSKSLLNIIQSNIFFSCCNGQKVLGFELNDDFFSPLWVNPSKSFQRNNVFTYVKINWLKSLTIMSNFELNLAQDVIGIGKFRKMTFYLTIYFSCSYSFENVVNHSQIPHTFLYEHFGK